VESIMSCQHHWRIDDSFTKEYQPWSLNGRCLSCGEVRRFQNYLDWEKERRKFPESQHWAN
jgi:hypothetical protein